MESIFSSLIWYIIYQIINNYQCLNQQRRKIFRLSKPCSSTRSLKRKIWIFCFPISPIKIYLFRNLSWNISLKNGRSSSLLKSSVNSFRFELFLLKSWKFFVLIRATRYKYFFIQVLMFTRKFFKSFPLIVFEKGYYLLFPCGKYSSLSFSWFLELKSNSDAP